MSWYAQTAWNYRLWSALQILDRKVAFDYFWGRIDEKEALRQVQGTNLIY